MKKTILPIMAVICCVPTLSITANAEDISETSQNIAVYSTGLISSYDVTIVSSGKILYLSGTTCCLSSMKSIGIKNIEIQYSSDNSNWHTYATISDLINSNSKQYIVSNSNIGTVSSGYYYRITCNHYAKESGLLGSSESISNISNSVYIP